MDRTAPFDARLREGRLQRSGRRVDDETNGLAPPEPQGARVRPLSPSREPQKKTSSTVVESCRIEHSVRRHETISPIPHGQAAHVTGLNFDTFP